MSTEYTVKRVGKPELVVGTTYFGGQARGKVMTWQMPPAELIKDASNAVVFDEYGVSYTVAEFFTEVVPWPMVEWEQSFEYGREIKV